jgi:hypothetical protein
MTCGRRSSPRGAPCCKACTAQGPRTARRAARMPSPTCTCRLDINKLLPFGHCDDNQWEWALDTNRSCSHPIHTANDVGDCVVFQVIRAADYVLHLHRRKEGKGNPELQSPAAPHRPNPDESCLKFDIASFLAPSVNQQGSPV